MEKNTIKRTIKVRSYKRRKPGGTYRVVRINLRCKLSKKQRSKKESKGHTPNNCWVCH
ncbi:hypothetical protein LCGC14_0454250 [marine sediment metagenome]|uniref:Uncharacterized protein n=1 Tax=marine sediment metagenome TaxID=412755 RepID=A0A0F9SH15_9ZZZZ